MSLTNYSRYKYTPDEMNEGDFLERFVVRDDEFSEVFDDIKSSNYNLPSQHYIIIGQRGQGKTTLLRKLHIEVQKDKKLSKFLVPVKFAEEQYQIRNLCRLWEEVADYLQSIYEKEFDGALNKMEEHFDDEDYELKCFSYLEKQLKQKNKKILLLVDNIDELLGKLKEKEQRRLREILLESNSFRIIGGSTKMLEQHFDYGKPFYEFFNIVKLQGLNKEDSFRFLKAIGKGEQKKKIEKIIKNEPQRIETLRRLTGGVPRTLVMLFDIFLDEEGNAFDDLLKILDEATPLYKHLMDDLPPVLQDIVHAMAINWDGMYAKEIAKETRLQSKEVSAQLKQLERKYGIVESESVGKNKIYKIQERFFNIWYLMRFGRKKDRQRVEWLVKFLISWCTPDELEKRSKKLIESIKNRKVSESYAYHMSEALAYCGISNNLEDSMKSSTKEYLESINSQFVNELTQSDVKIRAEARIFINKFDYLNAIKVLNKIKNKDKNVLEVIKRLNVLQDEFEEIYFLFFEKKSKNRISLEYINDFVMSLFYVRKDEFKIAEKLFLEGLKYIKKENIEINLYSYFIMLLVKEQYFKIKEFLEMPQYNLKEEYKAIWFALMTLMQDEFPDEIKKMGSEFQELVDDILEIVKETKEKYEQNTKDI